MSFSNIDYYRDQIKVTTLLETNVLDDTWKFAQAGGHGKHRDEDLQCGKTHCPWTGESGCAGAPDYDRPNCAPGCKSDSKCSNCIYNRNYTYFSCKGWPTDSCKAPGQVRVRGWQRQFQACGEFNGKRSCGVTYSGVNVGDCTNPNDCKRGKDTNCNNAQWNSVWVNDDCQTKSGDGERCKNVAAFFSQPTSTNFAKGCANCQYTFSNDDLFSFEFIKRSTSANTKIYPWIRTILNGQGLVKGSFQTLPDDIKTWLKNSMIISLCSHYWYQGLYMGWGFSGKDDHWDFISIGDTSDYVDRRDGVLLNQMQYFYGKYYPKTSPPGFPGDLLTCLKTTMIVPEVESSGNDVFIILPLSAKYYNDYTLSTDKSSFMSNLFSWTLDDDNFNYSPKTMVPKTPKFEVIEDATTINSINITLSNESFGCTNQNIPYKDFMDNKDSKYTYNFITSYNIKCKVNTWTAMLMLFVLSRINDTVNDTIIDKMMHDTQMLPVKKFDQDCSKITSDNRQKCLNYVTTYCQSIINNTPFSDSLIGKYVFNGDLGGGGNACNCYNSNLQPPVIAYPGNPTAMCFDTNCNSNTLIDLFGLSPDFCKTKCSEMWNWMFNANPTMGKPPPQFFDSSRYSNICGRDYIPLADRGKNVSLVIYMCVTAILILVCLYLSLIYFKISKKNNYITIGVTGAVLIGVIVFLAIDMRGKAACEGGGFPQKSVCKSAITGMSIPSDFCGFMSACECQTDNDCKGKDCQCESQVCLPSSTEGKQKMNLTQKSRLSYWQFGFSILLIILVIAIFALVYIIYGNLYLALFLLCLGITVILIAMIPQFNKYIDAKFSNPCNNTDVDTENQ